MKLQWLLFLGYFVLFCFWWFLVFHCGFRRGSIFAFPAHEITLLQFVFHQSIWKILKKNFHDCWLFFYILCSEILINHLLNLLFKLVLISWYCHIKLPQTWWLKKQEFILSHVWRLEIWSRCGQDCSPRRHPIKFKPIRAQRELNVCYDISSLANTQCVFHKLVFLGQNVWASLHRYFIS